MQTLQEYINTNSLSGSLITKLKRFVNPKNYAEAAKTLHSVLQKKSKLNQLRHDIYYYAHEIAKRFKDVEVKELIKLYKEAKLNTYGLKF